MKILHPTDFSECATQAEAVAIDLVRRLDGDLVLLQVLVETPLYSEGLISRRQVQTVYDAQRKWSEDRCRRAPRSCASPGSRRAGGFRWARPTRRSLGRQRRSTRG